MARDLLVSAAIAILAISIVSSTPVPRAADNRECVTLPKFRGRYPWPWNHNYAISCADNDNIDRRQCCLRGTVQFSNGQCSCVFTAYDKHNNRYNSLSGEADGWEIRGAVSPSTGNNQCVEHSQLDQGVRASCVTSKLLGDICCVHGHARVFNRDCSCSRSAANSHSIYAIYDGRFMTRDEYNVMKEREERQDREEREREERQDKEEREREERQEREEKKREERQEREEKEREESQEREESESEDREYRRRGWQDQKWNYLRYSG